MPTQFFNTLSLARFPKFPNIPSFKLPPLISRIGNRLPQWPHALALVSGLNIAVKMQVLPMDSLSLLEGKRFLIEVLDTGSCAQFSFQNGLFRPLFKTFHTNTSQASDATHEAADLPPDLIFRADLSTFLQMLTQQEDPDTLFFNRSLSIEGDTELGLIVKNMLDAVAWPTVFQHNASSPR